MRNRARASSDGSGRLRTPAPAAAAAAAAVVFPTIAPAVCFGMPVTLAKFGGAALCVALVLTSRASAAEPTSGPSLGEVVASRCAACHAAGSEGIQGLEGRSKADLAATLRGYRERSGPRSVMGSRARLMTDTEIDAAAAYFAARPAAIVRSRN